MTQLLLLFNHHLTPAQEADAIDTLCIDAVVLPPDDICRLWSQIPPELPCLTDYLHPVRSWFETQAEPGDHVLIQGDFGACYWAVQTAFAMGLVPIYSTTRREAVENHLADGTVQLTHHFRHVMFRKYEDRR